jgi:peroxiredoxin Q/BCP
VVLGVSKDSIASHQKFKAKLGIPFPLLSDPNKLVCEKYGVLKEKTMYGKRRIAVERSTFLIDGKGRVSAVFRGVKVKGHVKQLLEDLRG